MPKAVIDLTDDSPAKKAYKSRMLKATDMPRPVVPPAVLNDRLLQGLGKADRIQLIEFLKKVCLDNPDFRLAAEQEFMEKDEEEASDLEVKKAKQAEDAPRSSKAEKRRLAQIASDYFAKNSVQCGRCPEVFLPEKNQDLECKWHPGKPSCRYRDSRIMMGRTGNQYVNRDSDVWYDWNYGRGDPSDEHIMEDSCYEDGYLYGCCGGLHGCMTTVHKAEGEESEEDEEEEAPPSKKLRLS